MSSSSMSQSTVSIGLLCTAAAVVLVLGSNLVDVGRFHDALSATKARQQSSIESVVRAEAQLDALAKGTKALADSGNPNAQAILGVLRQNGVQINTGAPTAPQ